MTTTTHRQEFKIQGLDCAEEVAALKKEVGPVVGGEDRLAFEVLNARIIVNAEPGEVTPESVVAAVGRIGMRAEPWRDE